MMRNLNTIILFLKKNVFAHEFSYDDHPDYYDADVFVDAADDHSVFDIDSSLNDIQVYAAQHKFSHPHTSCPPPCSSPTYTPPGSSPSIPYACYSKLTDAGKHAWNSLSAADHHLILGNPLSAST